MHRRQLVETVGRRLGDQEIADTAVAAVFDVIAATVAAGEPVVLEGFGRFSRVQRPAHRTVPATFVPKFRAEVVGGAWDRPP